MTIYPYFLYLITGAVSGLLAGVFGIGGGLIMVPALLACFALINIPAEVIPSLALGTSLTSIFFTSVIATREHLRIGNLPISYVSNSIPLLAFLAAGVCVGSFVTSMLSRSGLLIGIAVFQLIVACTMFLQTLHPPKSVPQEVQTILPEKLNSNLSRGYLSLTGLVSSIGGIGGATLMIPYFNWLGIEYKTAAAYSTFFGSFIGLFGFVTFGLSTPGTTIPSSIGLVSVPALLSMVCGSYFFIKYGARLAARVDKKYLVRGFCLFLLLSGSHTLYNAFAALS